MEANSNNKKNKDEGKLALIRPTVDTQRAIQLARTLYGLKISDPVFVKEFVSYDDRNFYMKGTLPDHDGEGLQNSEDEFVLKILNHVDSENISSVNVQNEVLIYLKEQGFTCPVPARALNGEYTNYTCCLKSSDAGHVENDKVNAVRLLSYVPGKVLKDVPCTPQLLFSLGRYVGEMNNVLQVRTIIVAQNLARFPHSSINLSLEWFYLTHEKVI